MAERETSTTPTFTSGDSKQNVKHPHTLMWRYLDTNVTMYAPKYWFLLKNSDGVNNRRKINDSLLFLPYLQKLIVFRILISNFLNTNSMFINDEKFTRTRSVHEAALQSANAFGELRWKFKYSHDDINIIQGCKYITLLLINTLRFTVFNSLVHGRILHYSTS